MKYQLFRSIVVAVGMATGYPLIKLIVYVVVIAIIYTENTILPVVSISE